MAMASLGSPRCVRDPASAAIVRLHRAGCGDVVRSSLGLNPKGRAPATGRFTRGPSRV